MKITNRLALPSAFVNLAQEDRVHTPKRYSVTTILQPTRMILLKIRHDAEIVQDVSDMIWLIWGSAVHHVLEQADEYNMTEKRFEYHVKDGYYLTGQIDLYNKDTRTIEDYKTAPVWKVINQDFDDWRKQGMMYAWLMIKHGYQVNKVKFHALLKDWSPSKTQYDSGYPRQAIYTYSFDVNNLRDIEEYIESRFDEIIRYETSKELPLCTEHERWATPTKYALMKEGRQSAVKLYDSEAEVPKHKPPYYVEIRKGVDKRCDDYCLVKEFCSYWKQKERENI